MRNASEWVTEYVGKKYKPGGRGPDSFDCWGLVREVYANEFGIQLDDIPSEILEDTTQRQRRILEETSNDSHTWIRVQQPFTGCVVLCGINKARLHHVGVYARVNNVPRVLHGIAALPYSVCDLVSELPLRAINYLTFYKHAEWDFS